MFSLICMTYFILFDFQRVGCRTGFLLDKCITEEDSDFPYSEDFFKIISSSSLDWRSDEGGADFYETANDHLHLCPPVVFCNSTGDPPVCSCQPSCIVFKTCCYDAPILKNQSTAGWNFATLLDPWTEEDFICVETFAPFRGHHMIGLCPISWKDDVIRRKCEDVPPLLQEKENWTFNDPLSWIPVVGAGNVTFRNSFCAICHSVEMTTLEAWEVEMNCPASSIERFKADPSNDLSKLGSKCKMLLKPPKGVRHLGHLPCFPHETTSQCRAGMSNTTELSNECETYLAPICGSDGVIYKNQQCVRCNDVSSANPLEFGGLYCPNVQYGDIVPPIGPGVSGNIVPLSIVFDFSSQSGVRLETENFVYVEKSRSCNRGQVYDPFQGSCITFSCPEGYTFINGKCTPTYTGFFCNRYNSTPDAVMTISFTSPFQSTLESVNQHAQLCITDLLAMPFNSLYLRENFDTSISITTIALSQSPRSTIDIDFMVNFNLTNVRNLFENIIAFRSTNRMTAFPPFEEHSNESLAMKNVCDAISRIQFEYRCEKITELDCPLRFTRESHWTFSATNHTDSVYFPQLQHSIGLMDTNINVDIFFNGTSVTNFSSSAIYCRSLECPAVTLNASLFNVVSQNGKSYLRHKSLQNFTVPEDSFELLNELGLVKICSFVFSQNITDFTRQQESFFSYSQFQSYLSTIGTCLSVVCLWITLAIYMMFPTLRKAVSNKLIISYCITLSFAQASLLILALPTSHQMLCTLVAITSHYFWLVTFLSTTLLGFDLNQALAWSPLTYSQGDGRSRLIAYFSIGFGVPVCIVVPFTVFHFVLESNAPFKYGNDRVCWISDPEWSFYVLGIPLALCMGLNLVFFVHTVYSISKTRKQTAKITDFGTRRSFQDFLVFFKISLQLGFSWSISFVANVTGSPVVWYIFIALNSLQGVFIFIVFMFSTRVRNLWRQKLGLTSGTSKATINMNSL